jgi:hypothetical protein
MFTGKDHTKTANADLSNRAGVFFQPKLTVNEPNDVYEQEADSMADRVMRMANPGHENAFFKPAQTTIQRKCQHCEEEEKVHRKESSAAAQGGHELDNYVGSLGSSGQAMSASSRQFFEPRFGRDFSSVKLHTDSVAAKSAQSINALAYTTGNNIVFNSGQYSPNSDSGKKLIAHELTHVMQQGGAIGRKIQRQATPVTASTDVYICSKDLDTSPVGKHAFFRVGSPGSGNTTYSLQPVNQHLLDPDDLDRGERERNGDSEERYGVGCWQGVPDVNWPSDLNATGQCELSRISLSDLVREHGAYPVGHYCTLGPNSNTYVGHIARNCGVHDVDPPGWTPGIDDQPPPSGTFAPSRKYTLIAGCRTKECGHGM